MSTARSSPRRDSVTHRKELRRRVRNMLGTSRDDAPNALVTLKAMRDLSILLSHASNGRYAVKLTGPEGVETIDQAISREAQS
jgi:hypothetical protein